MDAFALWQVLNEGAWDGDDVTEIVASAYEVARLPLSRRAIFAGPAARLCGEASQPLRLAGLALLKGSTTQVALQLAVDALDDESPELRAVGLEMLRTAAQSQPLRWCHALFHPRADVRQAAVESTPHEGAASMLPWLRTDPVHGTHPAVVGAPLPLVLAVALWQRDELSDAEAAEAFASCASNELLVVLRGAPQRDPTEVYDALEGKPEATTVTDIASQWCALWQAVPSARAGMARVLVECLHNEISERDREPIRRRIAAAIRVHTDAHPDAEALAPIAVACTPILLSEGRWPLPIQRRALHGLERLFHVRAKVSSSRLGTLLDGPLARDEDGQLGITAALTLVGWHGANPVQMLEPRFADPSLYDTIAATPDCWPVLTRLGDSAAELIQSVRWAHPKAALKIVAVGLCHWAARHDALVTQVSESSVVDAPAVAAVLREVEPVAGDPMTHVPAFAKRLPLAQLAKVIAARLQRWPTSHVVVLARLLGARDANEMAGFKKALDRDAVRALTACLQLPDDGWSELPQAHTTELVMALGHPGEAWSKAEWPAIRDWVRGELGRLTEPPFQGMEVGLWMASGDRCLADVVLAVLSLDSRSERAQALERAAEAVEARVSDPDDASIDAEWLTTERGARQDPVVWSGAAHLLRLLDRPPSLAIPAARIVGALLGRPGLRAALLAEDDIVELIGPDICAQARRHLTRWPELDAVAIRDAAARPWLDESDDPELEREGLDSRSTKRVLKAVDAAIRRGAAGQTELLEILVSSTHPPGVGVIARSVARWTDAEVLAKVAALVEDDAALPWLRLRAGLGLAASDAGYWLPQLLAIACAPLPVSEDGPMSWLSPNDFDGLLAVARLDQGESVPGRWLRGIARALRGAKAVAKEHDEGTLQVSVELAASPHPHAHRPAVPRLLAARATSVAEELVRAARQSWAFPRSLKYALTKKIARKQPLLALPAQLEELLAHGDPETLLTKLPPQTHAVAAQTALDLVTIAGEGSFETCLAILRAVDPSIDVDAQWRQLLQTAPTGHVREAAVEQVPRLQSGEDKLKRIADTFAWGIRTGRALTGSFFDIRMTERREDLGFIRFGERALHISPLPILEDHAHGGDVVEGLILHELGHHIHHHSPAALAIWEKAQRAGLGSLLNLVADEHLERNLRALEPEYGDRLKRLATYAFQHLSRDVEVPRLLHVFGLGAFAALSARRLEVAERPGSVRLRSGLVLNELDRSGHPLARFVRALRMGMGNRHSDPVLAQALALFKGGFRQLDMAGLFEVTRALARLYGTAPADARGFDEAGPAGLLDIFGGHETIPGGEGEAERAGVRDKDVQREIERIFSPPKQAEPKTAAPRDPKRGMINVSTQAEFDRIKSVVMVRRNAPKHAELAKGVRRHAQRLRKAFEQMGLDHVRVGARLRGRTFDRSRALAVVVKRDPRMLVARKLVVAGDLFLGVAIDCSGSMSGTNMDKARRFGVLIAEAARGLRNVEARFVGFSDRDLFDAGSAQRCAVSQLQIHGGNNDAAGLSHVAGLARASKRRSKLLIMISDGLPTECSTTALRTLVDDLSKRHGMACAQVAVARIVEPCFPHYIEVLDEGMDVSVRKFTEIVVKLAHGALQR